jgi:hypothetical protein
MKKLIVLLALLTAAPANAQYGGGWGIYGPYGRPPRGAYGPPPPPRRYGPQMEPCIYEGDCRGPRYDTGPSGPAMPPFRLPPRW